MQNSKINKNNLYSIILLTLSIITIAFASLAHIYTNSGDTINFFSNSIFINNFMPFEYNVGRDMRFLPFQMLDYNLILLLPKFISRFYSVYGLLFIKALLLLFTIYKFINFICNQYNLKFDLLRFSMIIFTITSFKYTIRLFSEPVYSELLLSILFLIFFYFYIMGQKTGKLKYYILSIILMFYMTYMKEVAFSLFWTLSLIQILFNRKNLTKFDKIFNIASLLNGIIFLSLYYFIVITKYSNQYYIDPTSKTLYTFTRSIIAQFLKNPFLLVLIPLYYFNIKKLFQKDEFLNLHILSLIGAVYTFEFLIILQIGTWAAWYYIFSLVLSIPIIYFLIPSIIKPKLLKKFIISILIIGSIAKGLRIRRTILDFKDEKTLQTEIQNLLPDIKNHSGNICGIKNHGDWYRNINRLLMSEINLKTEIVKEFENTEIEKLKSCKILVFYRKTEENLLKFFKNTNLYEYKEALKHKYKFLIKTKQKKDII